MSWLNGWLWLIAALALAALELFAPGWVFMGLAASVGLMGILLLTGLWRAGLAVTLVVTAILSGRFARRRAALATTLGLCIIWLVVSAYPAALPVIVQCVKVAVEA